MCSQYIMNDFITSFGENSWYICRPISACRSLFGKEKLDYFVHAFVCRCRMQHITITNNTKIPHYTCHCGNRQFLDQYSYQNSHKELLAKIDTPMTFILTKTHATVKMHFLKPVGINISRDIVEYLPKEAYSLTIDLHSGKYTPKFRYKIGDDVKRYAKKALIDYIGEHYLGKHLINYSHLNIDTVSASEKEDMVLFFLQRPHIKDAHMYYWNMPQDLYCLLKEHQDTQTILTFLMHHRNEPSVKRAFYERYFAQMQQNYFDPLTPYIICRAFKDPNIVCTLLRKTSLRLSSNREYRIFTTLMDFLAALEILQTYYSQKSIISMLLDSSFETLIWEDVVHMLQLQKESGILETHFQKPHCKLQEIHEALAHNEQIRKTQIQNVSFFYNAHDCSATGLWKDELEFKLPKNAQTLCLWGESLQNCLCSYIDSITTRKSLIYGIFMHSKLLYAIELDNTYNIIQVSGFKNQSLPQHHLKQIDKWHKTYFYKTNFISA